MSLRDGQETLDQIIVKPAGQRLQRMKHRRHGTKPQNARQRATASPARHPLARLKLARNDLWLLFRRTTREKKPRVEAARAKRRRHPTPRESKIARIEMQTVML